MANIWKGNKVRLRAVEMQDLEDYFFKDDELDTDSQRTGTGCIFH